MLYNCCMRKFVFDTSKPFDFHWTGKFQAPDENWIHMTRPLNDFEFVLVTDGDFYIGDEGKKSVVKTGEYRICSPSKKQYGTKPSSCAFYWLHFMAPFSEKDGIKIPEQGTVPHPERLVVLLKQLSDCDKKYRNPTLNNYLCTSILCELESQLNLSAGDSGKTDREKSPSLHGAQVALYSDMINYINWKIRENIKVSEIAAYFGYNAKYITTFFRKASGKSIKEFILERKIEEAKAMLCDSTRQVSQIGYDLGFEDNHNFTRAFKKITGQTPSDYRNSFADRMLYNV